MEFGSKKHKGLEKCIEERDRLSELPDEVLVNILSFLPIFYAVRTVLLRRFGKLWILVPTLDFNDSQFNPLALFSRFSLFVHNVLILHKRPTIDKFCVKMMSRDCTEEEKAVAKIGLEVWMRFVLSREAKALILDCNDRAHFSVSGSIFTSQYLVRLNLEQCSIQLPIGVHMGSLRTLAFVCVTVDDGDFNEFVSGCPCLQEIFLEDIEGFRVLSFSSSSIEKLEIWEDTPCQSTAWTIDCPNLKILAFYVFLDGVNVINVPSVRELTIGRFYHDGTEYEEDAHQFKRFLEGCQNVEVLTLTELAVLQFTCCLIMNVGFPRNRWKRVAFGSAIQATNIAGICSLLRNSPCLEELIIHVEQGEALRVQGDSDLCSEVAFSPCVVPHLKLVYMHGYGNPHDVQLGLIEFLLKSAVHLEKLIIFSNERSHLTSAEGQQFVNQLSNFSRASTKARIMFE